MATTSHPCIIGKGEGREAKQMLFLKGAPDVLVSYDDIDDDDDERYDDNDDRDDDNAGGGNNDDDVDHDRDRDDDNNDRYGDERIVLYS
jgi:hypothetical protein